MSKTIDTVIDNLVTDVKDLLDFGADLAKDAADRVIDLVNPPEKVRHSTASEDADPSKREAPSVQAQLTNFLNQLDPETVVAALKFVAKNKGNKK